MTSANFSFKRLLIGKPIATAEEGAHRLSKKIALPVFSSDAISSTAYATEEILVVLILAGSAALRLSVPISLGVAALLAIVALSYQQTVHAYPSGGGSYIVGHENLGVVPGLIAAASLLVDYVMTVAVSVASGVAAITSAFPSLFNYRVLFAVILVLFVAFANLRGLRESGTLFSIPTYSFIVLCAGLIVVGVFRWATGHLHPIPHAGSIPGIHSLTLFLVLRAFAGGCSAMTGTEAISNGVPASPSGSWPPSWVSSSSGSPGCRTRSTCGPKPRTPS
jgi:amino acid transporter